MRRKYWIILAAIPVLLVGADLAYWEIASARVGAGLQAWIDARRTEGWEIKMGRPSTGGWPQAATVTVPNFTMRHVEATCRGR